MYATRSLSSCPRLRLRDSRIFRRKGRIRKRLARCLCSSALRNLQVGPARAHSRFACGVRACARPKTVPSWHLEGKKGCSANAHAPPEPCKSPRARASFLCGRPALKRNRNYVQFGAKILAWNARKPYGVVYRIRMRGWLCRTPAHVPQGSTERLVHAVTAQSLQLKS